MVNVVKLTRPASMFTPVLPLAALIRSGARVQVPCTRNPNLPNRSRSTSMAAPARVAADNCDLVRPDPSSVVIGVVRSMNRPKTNGPVAAPTLQFCADETVGNTTANHIASNVFRMMVGQICNRSASDEKFSTATILLLSRPRGNSDPLKRSKNLRFLTLSFRSQRFEQAERSAQVTVI
jgi:hypothetical protein